MDFDLIRDESMPDLKARMAIATTAALDKCLMLYDGSPEYANHLRFLRAELKRRQDRTDSWRLWENRLLWAIGIVVAVAAIYYAI